MKKLFSIFFIFICVATCFGEEQGKKKNLNLSFSTISTESEKVVVGFVAEWLENINVEKFLVGDKWLAEISPEIRIQSGEEDAFNGIVAKVKGYSALFQKTEIGGKPIPDSSKYFSVFAFSGGIETNKDFDSINGIIEIGYIPFKKKINSTIFLGLNPAIGMFLQGGYKFELDDSNSSNVEDNSSDKSDEKPNSGLLRAKLGGKGEFKVYDFSDKYSLHIIPEGWVWYDVVNSEIYHQIIGVIRLTLSENKHFDFKYENGSGSPNFNEGDQFSANLTIRF